MQDRYGTMADLARELGISRSAISKAFKKHSIQRTADGKYNLNYLTWLLSQKQEQRRSEGQRSARRKPAGLNNPHIKREVVRTLTPIWQMACVRTLQQIAEPYLTCWFEEARPDFEGFLFLMRMLFEEFHAAIDTEFNRDPADHDFEWPAILDFDPFDDDLLEYLVDSLGLVLIDEPTMDDIGFHDRMPLDVRAEHELTAGYETNADIY